MIPYPVAWVKEKVHDNEKKPSGLGLHAMTDYELWDLWKLTDYVKLLFLM